MWTQSHATPECIHHGDKLAEGTLFCFCLFQVCKKSETCGLLRGRRKDRQTWANAPCRADTEQLSRHRTLSEDEARSGDGSLVTDEAKHSPSAVSTTGTLPPLYLM